MRLKNLKSYDLNDVPDHVIEELKNLTDELATLILPYFQNHDPNLILSALSRLNAISIIMLVSKDPDELKSAARTYAIGLIKNIEQIADIKILNDK